MDVEDIQRILDAVARDCMRMIGKPGISDALNNRLGRFLYGCMNQRLTIAERVAKRGSGEYAKVLEFAARAARLLADIERELERSRGDDD